MKKITILSIFICLSCSHLNTNSEHKTKPETSTTRSPSSQKNKFLWGKEVDPESEELLEEIENRPTKNY